MHTNRLISLFRDNRLLCILLMGALLWFDCSASLAGQQKVYFAGFAFLVESSHIDEDLPYSRKIFALKDSATNAPRLNDALRSCIGRKTFTDFELVTDSLGDHQSASALSLAIALDYENVNTEQIDGLFKVVINIHGQILLFDFKEKKILAAYPVRVRVNDALEKAPDDAHLMHLFEKIYFDNIGNINVLDEFIKRLSSIKLKEGFNQHIKVSEVVIEEKSKEYLPDNFKKRPDALKTFIAQQFSTFLSYNLGIAILPYSTGEAIGNTMACRFQNGNIFNLTIPKEDISLKITLRGFKKVKLDENVTGASWAYGTFIHFSVLNPFQDTIVNAKFKSAAVKIVPSRQTTVNDWPAFQESMLSLFDQLTQQISLRDSSWIETKAEDKDVKKQLKELEKTLKGT